MFVCSVLALLLFLGASRGSKSAVEDAVITGVVYDPGSHQPVSRVKISWKDRIAASNQTGRYRLSVPIGVREVSFQRGDRVARKMAVLREAKDYVLDALLPADSSGKPALTLNRGLLLAPGGRDLQTDSPASSLSITDDYGNNERFFQPAVRGPNAQNPIWFTSGSLIYYGVQGVVAKKEALQILGVYQYQLSSGQNRKVFGGHNIYDLSKSPHHNAIVASGTQDIFLLENPESESPATKKIFSLTGHGTRILSVEWGTDDRIYFTVDEQIPIDNRRSYSRSRIASIKPDGTGLMEKWSGDENYSYRYPTRAGSEEELYFSRFSLDGKEQTVWKRSLKTGATEKLLDRATEAVRINPTGKIVYYIYRNDLRRAVAGGPDILIVNSAEHADFLE